MERFHRGLFSLLFQNMTKIVLEKVVKELKIVKVVTSTIIFIIF